MKRSLRRIAMWVLVLSVFVGLIPGSLLVTSAAVPTGTPGQ
ncbi:hypothetical protein [Paenibacillus sp. CMAA1364]